MKHSLLLTLLLPISAIAEEIIIEVQEAVHASAESQIHSPAKTLPTKKMKKDPIFLPPIFLPTQINQPRP